MSVEVAGACGAEDPLAPPYLDEEVALARAQLGDARRWHRISGVDWLAVRLQFGRGRSFLEVSAMFGVSGQAMRDRAKHEGWANAMTERDRRKLARLVWIGGLERGAASEAELAELRAACAWSAVAREAQAPLFTMMDPLGETRSGFRMPHGDAARAAIGARLDALMERLAERRAQRAALAGADGGTDGESEEAG